MDEWQAFQFSQANPEGMGRDNVAALLRRVADSIGELGAVQVMDIVFHTEVTAVGELPSMTVCALNRRRVALPSRCL